MLIDIVVDANVLMHAQNPTSGRMEQSLEFVRTLKGSHTHLCVDEGFSSTESKNRSRIGSEYLSHLRAGSVGYEVIAYLALSQRIMIVPSAVPKSIRDDVQKQIPKGPDRIYVQVAFNSREKVLVSHDLGDIPQTVRGRLRRNHALRILIAESATAALVAPIS
jgi:ABC-type nitrate/sulfonate/bicarbonate transport system ATPase subunit